MTVTISQTTEAAPAGSTATTVDFEAYDFVDGRGSDGRDSTRQIYSCDSRDRGDDVENCRRSSSRVDVLDGRGKHPSDRQLREIKAAITMMTAVMPWPAEEAPVLSTAMVAATKSRTVGGRQT